MALTDTAARQAKPREKGYTLADSLGLTLYIADTGYTHSSTGRRHIRRFAVGADGCSLSGGEIFAECSIDLYDGFRIDTEGNLWVGAGDGVHCIAPDGCLIGKIRVPEVVANVCFGGVQRKQLFALLPQRGNERGRIKFAIIG